MTRISDILHIINPSSNQPSRQAKTLTCNVAEKISGWADCWSLPPCNTRATLIQNYSKKPDNIRQVCTHLLHLNTTKILCTLYVHTYQQQHLCTRETRNLPPRTKTYATYLLDTNYYHSSPRWEATRMSTSDVSIIIRFFVRNQWTSLLRRPRTVLSFPSWSGERVT